jgi:hypothetical protein
MNPYFIAGSVVAVVVAYGVGHWQGDDAGQVKVNAQWDKERAEQMAAFAEAQRQAREKEQALQQGADNLRMEKEREIKNINARATALANSLRERPDRPTTEGGAVPGAAGTGKSGCTGKDLYRQDGEILIGIAREADELRIALQQCYSQYDSVLKSTK